MYTLRNFPCYTELFKSIILSKYLHKILSSSCTRLYFSVFLYQGVMTGLLFIVVVQLFSRVWLFVTPWTVAHQTSPVLHHLLHHQIASNLLVQILILAGLLQSPLSHHNILPLWRNAIYADTWELATRYSYKGPWQSTHWNWNSMTEDQRQQSCWHSRRRAELQNNTYGVGCHAHSSIARDGFYALYEYCKDILNILQPHTSTSNKRFWNTLIEICHKWTHWNTGKIILESKFYQSVESFSLC